MAINNPYIPNYQNGIYQPTQTQTPFQQNNGVFTTFVKTEEEVASRPNPVTGCNFYILDGDTPVIFAKYADGRPMEVYDMVLRQPPTPPEYLTVERFNELMDEKMEELAKRFQKTERKAQSNG